MIRSRLTYANAMSTIAVVLSLGGATAFAATHLSRNSVGSRQLRANAVTGGKVKDGSLRGVDINAATLGPVRSAQFAQTAASAEHADAAPPTGPAGGDLTGSYPDPSIAGKAVSTAKLADAVVTAPKLAPASVGSVNLRPGAVKAQGLGGIFTVEESVSQHGIIHGPGSLNVLMVQCPAGSEVISGGFDSGVIGLFEPSALFRSGNGWAVSGFVSGANDVGVRVFAYCLEA